MDTRVQPKHDTRHDGSKFDIPIGSKRETEYLQMLRDLKNQLADKTSECEVLRINLDQSMRDLRDLNRELNESKLRMFQNDEDSKKTLEETHKARKLEEDYVKLMSEYLNLSEHYDHFRGNLYDSYVAKTNAINNYECFMSNEMLRSELDGCRAMLNNQSAQLTLASAKLRNLEEENSLKDKSIAEFRKTLDDAKVTHKHEIDVLQEYIQCLKSTISSYEKTLIAITEDQPGDGERDSVAS